ncbi:MAG: MATE family efflux transporter [Hyphomicrobiaceae bacterium]
MTEAAGPSRPHLRAALTHRHVLAIAIPIILSNTTTPLIGFVDTVVIGRLGNAALMGGVAIGAVIFNIVYWGFGFLRMGTTGLTAQAVGRGDASETAAMLFRGLAIAATAGLLLVVLQTPIAAVTFAVLDGSAAVESTARHYYDIRIWSSPAGIANYALLGWFIGLGRAGRAFLIQLFLNGLNILLAIVFVIGLGWGVTGVAVAVLIAELSALALGLVLAIAELRRRGARWSLPAIFEPNELKRVLSVNSDIFVRSLAVQFVLIFFTAQGARSGDLTLAANAVLHNLLMLSVYLLDGFAFAAEALVGQSIGARDYDRFRRAAIVSTLWAAGISVLLGLVLIAAGPAIIDFMTTSPEVREAARRYLPWAALGPVLGVWCFQLDGIFIGATRTRDMRNMMLLSVAIYVVIVLMLMPIIGNHGLWLALMLFYLVRTVTLWRRLPGLIKAAFGDAAPMHRK